MGTTKIDSVGGCCTTFFCLLVACAVGHAESVATTRPTGEPIAQLAPGEKAGTFHLVYHATAKFSMPGSCPLKVSLTTYDRHELVPLRLNSAGDFTLEVDVAPGTYNVTVAPQRPDADYWPSDWQRLHVGKNGGLYRPRGWLTQSLDFVLERRMRDLSPASPSIAGEARPVLKWAAVPGATHYRGDYRINNGMAWFDVESPQFIIGAGVTSGAACDWRVLAVDADGKTLARGEAGFFGEGTNPALLALVKAGPTSLPINLPAISRPYLGIQPLPTQVPKDPSQSVDLLPGGGTTIRSADEGFIPGIQVMEVLPASPAIDAELIPDDVIVAVDGNPVDSDQSMNVADTAAFVRRIIELGAGRKITLTVRRFRRELTLHATIGLTGGAQPVVAATQPNVIPQAVPPPDNSSAAKLAWSDVDGGTPATFEFHDKADVDITLSTKQGLASNTVIAIAALPNGGMAFGTFGGLSLWDGAQIRTYTGPSYSEQSGTVSGNSGLPANQIQDLLCDSRGRLWVATPYGVCRIDPGTGRKWHVLQDPNRTFTSARGLNETLDVQKIYQASDGTIVLGGRCASIILIDPKTDAPKLIHHDEEPNHWVTGIAQDKRGRIWFAVFGLGVLRYNGQKVEAVTEPWVNGKELRGLAIDGAGTVWIADGEKGLSALHADGTSESVGLDQLPGNVLMGLQTDRAGRLWVLSYVGLAVHSTQSNGTAGAWQYAELDNAQFVPSLFEAPGGQWWLGLAGASRLSKLPLSSTNPHVAAVERLKHKIEAACPRITADRNLAVGPNGVVVGVADQRLLRFDGKKWEDLSNRLGKFDVNQIKADFKGTIWVATSGSGLVGLDPDGNVRRYNNEPDSGASVIYSMDQTPDGTLYVGTQHGLFRVRGQNWEPVKSDLFQVGQVLVDRRGRVWMMEVTYSQLYVYDGKTFREVKQQTPIADRPLEPDSLRLDDVGNVLVDVAAEPGKHHPQRTFEWDATGDIIGPPVEVAAPTTGP